jgi:hypothetical protein
MTGMARHHQGAPSRTRRTAEDVGRLDRTSQNVKVEDLNPVPVAVIGRQSGL